MSDTSDANLKGVTWVGIDDPERTLFDALIPLTEGTSYNAYLIEGATANALIDTAEPEVSDAFLARLDEAVRATASGRLDYVISNHAEQDHSGSIPLVLERYQEAVLVTNSKCHAMLKDLLDLPEDRVRLVADGDSLDLGGRELQFLLMAWVHWPETMVTWLPGDHALFPCDLFGAHQATGGQLADWASVEDAAKLYYATIMMPYAGHAGRHLKRLRELDIRCILPSHGPIHTDVETVLEAYERWTSGSGKGARVLIAGLSMHGSTGALIDALAAALEARGGDVQVVDLTLADVGAAAVALLDARALVLAAPNVLNSAHPTALHALTLTELVKPKLAFTAFMGSYGWSAKPLLKTAERLDKMARTNFEPILTQGRPKAEDLARIEILADDMIATLTGAR